MKRAAVIGDCPSLSLLSFSFATSVEPPRSAVSVVVVFLVVVVIFADASSLVFFLGASRFLPALSSFSGTFLFVFHASFRRFVFFRHFLFRLSRVFSSFSSSFTFFLFWNFSFARFSFACTRVAESPEDLLRFARGLLFESRRRLVTFARCLLRSVRSMMSDQLFVDRVR